MILAAFLVNGGRRSGRCELVLAEITLKIDDNILERAILAGNYLLCHRRLFRVLPLAGRFRSHVDDFHFGWRAVEFDRSSYRTGRGRVYGFASRVGYGRFICRLFISTAD